ncbi:zinc ribbon domain-containing protein [Methanobacterium sp. BAmetb5]|uniref:zinc ribbon domain-containing protein n=1 Tax=Methanobacterium sp. BAmetb5 TaxID=2025351 RepID=UPI000E98632C|nr:zinc ribbon domain-containing protein [Methanobacterium sp. BAmetb5]AXV40455.1 MAG: pseudomurein-binding repeat-containing protein [Methanobacterium sp. BAmetb5]
MKCENCGYDNDADAAFCEQCGAKLPEKAAFGRKSTQPEKEESKTINTALIVAVVALVVILGIMGGILLKMGSSSTPANTTNTTPAPETISLATGFPVSQVPGLASEISRVGVGFSTITYQGVTLDKNQCLYILAKGITMINTGQTGNIPINQYKSPDNAYGTVTSATIAQADYLSMAQRTCAWMDNSGQTPNYIGITVSGQPDLSPDSMLNMYAKVLTQYKSTGQLPASVTIP